MRILLPFLAASITFAAGSIASELPIKDARYASTTEALRDLDRQGHALTSQAAMWLMRGASLDWPVDSTGFGLSPWVVTAIPTRNRRFCVLAGARRAEFGPFGEARYALMDSTGRLQWTMTGKLDAWPAIADNGTVALLWVGGHAPSGRRPDSLNVEFISVSGQVIGSKAWGNRTWRPLQRGALAEVYGFAPVSNQFFATVNQCNDDSVESDSDTLYAVAPDGHILWSRGLGAMRTNELWFSTNGDRVAVTDLLQASVGYNNRVFVFDSMGRIIARQAISEARGADGSVLDPTTDELYAYSFDDEIVALSLKSGRFQHRQEIDVVKKLQGFDDKRIAVRAARLVQRVEIERNRRARSH